MVPQTHDLEVVRGTTPRLAMRFKDAAGVPIAYDDIRVSVVSGRTALFRSSLGNGVEAAEDDFVIWRMTAQQTDMLKDENEYEVEIWTSGDEMVWLRGKIHASGGHNDNIGDDA